MNQWRSVLFSDESTYHFKCCDWCLQVCGWLEKRIYEKALQETDRFSVGSIMVWTGIMYNNLMDLVIVASILKAVQYIVDILEEYVVSIAIGVGPG